MVRNHWPEQMPNQHKTLVKCALIPKVNPHLVFSNVLEKNATNTYFLRVNNLFSQESVFTSIPVKEPPVHLQIPDKSIARADETEDDPQVEEHLGVTVYLI